MSISASASLLCACVNKQTGASKCHLTHKLALSCVLAIIGAAFIGTGLYLSMGGTGTIPSLTSGWALIAAGAAFLLSACTKWSPDSVCYTQK